MQMNTFSDSLIYKISKKDIMDAIEDTSKVQRHYVDSEEDITITEDFGELQDIVDYFIETFQKSFTKQQTREMLYRLKRLVIERKEGTLKRLQQRVRLGTYNSFYNRITFYSYKDERIKEELKTTFIHELLHMASSRNTLKGHLSGFELAGEFGKNLNEGYTEYMREKYFGKGPGKYTEANDWRIMVVKGLEYIVGEKRMEELYFNADLAGLIRELERYASREDIIKLIFIMGRVETDTMGFSKKKFRQIIHEIAKINQRKLDRQLANNEITRAQYTYLQAIKVDELERYNIWSEHAKIVTENNCFVITELGYTSPLYEVKPINPKAVQKKYE